MANYQSTEPYFKLVPFLQGKQDAYSFFLVSPFDGKTVLNFFCEIDDCMCPDAFYDMVTLAVDSLMVSTLPEN